MAQVTLTPSDFGPWGVEDDPKLAELIEDVLAQAATLAPCIVDPAFPYDKAARATLREAVLRRLDAGTGGVVTKTQGTGPFSESETIDNRLRRTILQPADISDLQRLCGLFTGVGRRAGAVNMDPNPAGPSGWLADRPDLWFQRVSPVPPPPGF